ncbi:Isoflavone reductase-like protein [Fusarium oxysporum f. sp. albedinis]|nr:Isoflavone reductase-like protein [Fusarium oxysporum f. sp. albedinis]
MSTPIPCSSLANQRDTLGARAHEKLPLHWYVPPSAILLTPTSVKMECQKKWPWLRVYISRRGLLYAPAFAYKDYEVQKRTLDLVKDLLRWNVRLD